MSWIYSVQFHLLTLQKVNIVNIHFILWFTKLSNMFIARVDAFLYATAIYLFTVCLLCFIYVLHLAMNSLTNSQFKPGHWYQVIGLVP